MASIDSMRRAVRGQAMARMLLPMLVVSMFAACAGAPKPRAGAKATSQSEKQIPASPDRAVDSESAEVEALLLLLGDRRVYEPIVVSRALESNDAQIRWRLALVLAQIGDPRVSSALVTLLTDKDPKVRRAAAFALGRIESADAKIDDRLLRAAVDADRETGLRAIESLARRGTRLEDVASALVPLPADEILTRLMPPLFRFKGPAVVRWAELGLESGDPVLRAWAAYGLAREPQDIALTLLRSLTEDTDPWVAGWAARALGRLGDRSDVERLEPMLARSDAGPVVQALRAVVALVARGVAAPPESWRPTVLQLLDDPRVGVRVSALEAAPMFLRDDVLGAVLAKKAEMASTERERLLALAALAIGADPRAEGLTLSAARDASRTVRASAAVAAGDLGMVSTLRTLSGDSDAGVRTAALQAMLIAVKPGPGTVPRAIEDALGDADPAPRAVALGWLAENPLASHDDLVAAIAHNDRLPDAWLAGIAALVALAAADAGERDAVITTLESLASSKTYVVRRAAARGLSTLSREAPALGPATRRSASFYREVVAQTREFYRVEMVVAERGVVTLELDCRQAPIGCLSFVQLARQGFFEGLAFHRVIPDFVVQAGDPRGDGRGGPGFRIRSEPTLIHYARGVLGLARGEPDTAGSQFFITLSAQPHLDGDYTAFGRVTAGMDVLDRIVQGDRIERFVALP